MCAAPKKRPHQVAMDTSISAIGLDVLERYFKENDFPLTRHHIDSYEKAIFEDIPSIIHSNNPIVFLKEPLTEDGSVFAYRIEIFIGGAAATPADLALSISPPIVSLDGGQTVRRLFPNEARLRNMTYAAQVSADLLFRLTITRPKTDGTGYETEVKDAPIIRNFPLFSIPILLRSRLCTTGVADSARLEEMGECRNDYGGYFIIRGAEKVLITREEQAFNTLYVEKKAKDPSEKLQAYASVVSLNPHTKQTRRVAMYLGSDGEIRVAIPMVRGVFPLFILFRAMGLESDEEIVRMIFPDVGDKNAEELIPSIEDAYPIMSRFVAIRYIMTLTKGFTEAHVLDILQNLMLPHVPDEPLTRAQYLAEMAREVILANIGLRGKTDRDDMRGHRFLTTGVLVRELFNGCYKEWRKALILSIDTTYRANAGQYQGEAALTLFQSENGNLDKIFQPQLLNQAIMRGFGGRWGTNADNEKTGVIQPLARISYLDATSHQRRVVSDFDSGMKTTGPRKLNTSQIGFFCTSETPTGAHIGLTKNMSIMTQFSFSAAMEPVYKWMKTRGWLIPVAATTAIQRATAAVVKINGGTVGFTTTPRDLVHVLKLMKWNACIAPTASITFSTMEKTVQILLDEGRPVRPLWHINGEGAAFLGRLSALKEKSWRALAFGSLLPTATISSTTFVDPLAAMPDADFTAYEAALKETAGFIEYCDPVEMNDAYVSWWGTAEELHPEHTHVEIHPSTMTGLMASMIPYSNHNQAPRNQLSNSQSKQGIGYMATNIHNRFDTYSNQLCYGEAPLCRTFYYENIANGEMPYGYNVIVGVTSDSGYNQDDGLIFNRDSIARGLFNSIALRSYDCAEEADTWAKTHSHVANPDKVPTWTSLKPGLDYTKLDETGVIRVGEYVNDKTVLVGRYMVLTETNEVKDASVTPNIQTHGRVDAVAVLHQAGGQILVKVRVIEMRAPVLGDKFSTRHGQKGTIGMFVPAEDLPRTAEGLVPDLMVNPGGLISRMTVAQLVEMVGGRVGAEIAAKLNATTFCNGGDIVTQFGDALQTLGFSRGGDNIMYCGTSGKQLKTEIFMCPLYFMRLKHMTEDKVNARGAGRREIRTHQPTGGRANEGGLRIGEMERDSLCAHGISSFLQESMMKRGDGTTFWICNGCGRVPIYNEAEKLFVCPTCDGPLIYNGDTAETLTLQIPTRQSRATFSRIAVPYTLKLLDQEITAFMNAGFRFVTEGSVGRLRDADWNWPAEEFDFKVGERGVTDAGDVNPEARMEEEQAAEDVLALKRLQQKELKAATKTKARGTEGAKEVMDAAVPTTGLGPIQFSNRLKNEWADFGTFAYVPTRMPAAQIPAPDGTAYPSIGIAPNGSPDVAAQTWPTVEHYYQAMKFPTDPSHQEAIRRAPSPAKAKSMGLDPAHPIRGDWDAVKDVVMKTALMEKFRQHPALLDLLQSTGERQLINATRDDQYWGGLGKGKNRLGELLMDVRAELKESRPDLMTNPVIEEEKVEYPTIEEAAADIVDEAKQIVKEVTAPPQTGGVFMIINPNIGGVETKARRARQRGGDGPISWMSPNNTNAPSVSPDTPLQLSSENTTLSEASMGGQNVEITVQKLE